MRTKMGNKANLTVVTPCSRPRNLRTIAEHLEEARTRFNLTWMVVHDCLSGSCEDGDLQVPFVGKWLVHAPRESSVAGHGQVNAALDLIHGGLVWRLDDDNLPVPGFFGKLRELEEDFPEVRLFLFAQRARGRYDEDQWSNGVVSPVAKVGKIDSAQFVFRSELAADPELRFEVNNYKADGVFAEALSLRAHAGLPGQSVYVCAEPLTQYNALSNAEPRVVASIAVPPGDDPVKIYDMDSGKRVRYGPAVVKELRDKMRVEGPGPVGLLEPEDLADTILDKIARSKYGKSPVPHPPRVSVITGLHEPGNRYVEEAYKSLFLQTVEDWEWVIVENNGGWVPPLVRSDSRVRVIGSSEKSVGAIKRLACESATAPVVAELDADDLLEPTALEEVLYVTEERGADFCYSDFAEFEELEGGVWQPRTYGEAFGWKTYKHEHEGRTLLAMVAPEATPQNVRLVFYAPNHVRAWRADAYWKVGGHDKDMAVMDDHDLFLRFFTQGRRVVKIDRCLYLYRKHAGNTVAKRNAEIQVAAWDVYERYVWKLAEMSGKVWYGSDTSCRDQMKPGEWLFLFCPKERWTGDRERIPMFKGQFQVSRIHDLGHTVLAHLIRLGHGYEPMGEVCQ